MDGQDGDSRRRHRGESGAALTMNKRFCYVKSCANFIEDWESPETAVYDDYDQSKIRKEYPVSD